MANIQLSVDLGSKFLTICQKGVGLVLREPCIAIAQKTKDRLEIREAGFRAESIISTSLGVQKWFALCKKALLLMKKCSHFFSRSF